MAADETQFLPTIVDNFLPPVNHSSSIPFVHVAGQLTEACNSWLAKSPSRDTRTNYNRDVRQFLIFVGHDPDHSEQLAMIRPHQVAAWRDALRDIGLTNASIRRKMTALRSLYSYLQT